MLRNRKDCHGFGLLELILALAVLALISQLWPPILDVRQWSRATWFILNLVIVLALVVARFGPDSYQEWKDRRQRLLVERTKAEKVHKLREQREAIERMAAARKRRIY